MKVNYWKQTQSQGLALLSVAVVFLVQFLWLFKLTDLYAVNILFWDQWDFYNPIFDGAGWANYFLLQHGPIREGLGLFFTAAVNHLTGWNGRAESFSILFILVMACFAALSLKFRLTRTISFYDSTIVLIVLTTSQLETIVGTPNAAHSALPLLLIFLYCHAWLCQNFYWRYSLVLIFNFFLIYTGFGIFMGIVTFGLIALDIFHEWRLREWRQVAWQSCWLALSFSSLLHFKRGYVFASAADCFGFRWEYLWQYPVFSGFLFSRFLSLTYSPGRKMLYLAAIVGVGFLIVLIFISTHQIKKMILSKKKVLVVNRIIFILGAFSVLYALNISVGRLCLSWYASQSSRYATLLVPGFIAAYFWVDAISKEPLRKIFLTGYLSLIIIGIFFSFEPDSHTGEFFRVRKQTWKICYLQTGDIAGCDKTTGYQIYPDPERARLKQKLDYLKQRNLNLFLDVVPER